MYFVSSLTLLPPNERCSEHYSQFEEYKCWKLVINRFDLPYDTRLYLPNLWSLWSFSVRLCTRVPGSGHGPGRAAVSPLDNGALSPSYNHTMGGAFSRRTKFGNIVMIPTQENIVSNFGNLLRNSSYCVAWSVHLLWGGSGWEAPQGMLACGWTLQKHPKLPFLRHCCNCQNCPL